MNLEIQLTEIKALVLRHDATTNIRMCFFRNPYQTDSIYRTIICKPFKKYLNSRMQESYSVEQRFPHRQVANI